ncbi:reverse transcriptase zinc-binding domain-containing protein [Artemisia annua]|uniref:Reverse transcriptase zinc-binding domain-containing protein n=1 Tax=Artemisia annua TaxID=35608 RepID=A0A2U1QJS4_ARTAN|nr:reverse transcriptase zinc-binding domain-containing protein [Artemisia annua]
MPIESTEPPDVISDEFRTLTGITSGDLHHRPIFPNVDSKNPRSRGRPKGTKNRPKRVLVQACSPGSASAGAGAILKRLRNSKVNGLGRSRSDSSPMVPINGKRLNHSNIPVDDVLSKVLDKMAHDKNIAEQMVFREGTKGDGRSVRNELKSNSHCLIGGNDGSFINKPIDPVLSEPIDSSNVGGNKESNMDCSVDPCFVSNTTSKLKVADVEHIGVENSRKANKDGVEVEKQGSVFIFGDVQSGKGILKKPTIGLSTVQFGPSLFYKSNSVWSASNHGAKALKADNSLNIESFAEKLKKGVEDRELQMNFAPQCVSIGSDGSRRIAISVEDIKKVLVEVSAADDLPHFLEIEYPQIGDRPVRIGGVNVATQDKSATDKDVDDGFTQVGKKNKPVSQFNDQKGNSQSNNFNNRSFQSRSSQVFNKSYGGNARVYGNRLGPNQKFFNGNSKQQGNVKAKSVNVNSGLVKQSSKGGVKQQDSGQGRSEGLVQKPPLSSKFNEHFKPKVLVRGSGSKDNGSSAMVEDLPLSNSFAALEDQDMKDKDSDLNGVDEEYAKVVWPKLKAEVDEVMQTGKYPSMDIKSNWSLAQLDYFFQNCSKFGLEPDIDEDDVESVNEGMAVSMKPENASNCSPADSHKHLFFGCKFSSRVWCFFKDRIKLDVRSSDLSQIVDFIVNRPCNKSVWSIIQRLVIGAMVYVIWQERNLRTFQGQSRSIESVCCCIKEVVRIRLLSLKFKSSKQVLQAAKIWDFQVLQKNVNTSSRSLNDGIL